MTAHDPRVVLARPDLAASTLEGAVRANRFVDTTPMQIVHPTAALRRAADARAEQVDQLLFGEMFDLAEVANGHAWGQARRDGYVGFVEAAALARAIHPSTHRIGVLRTFAFATPSIKAPATGPLSLNALVCVTEERNSLALAQRVGWIATGHLAPIGTFFSDPVAVAERFVGTPYLWGGRDSLGLDCSGLVQQALYACGCACPRDTDQQATLGAPAPMNDPRRGDLVFWRGHVGLMIDGRRLVHANAHHMAVAIEPLGEVVARIRAGGGGEPIAMRRL